MPPLSVASTSTDMTMFPNRRTMLQQHDQQKLGQRPKQTQRYVYEQHPRQHQSQQCQQAQSGQMIVRPPNQQQNQQQQNQSNCGSQRLRHTPWRSWDDYRQQQQQQFELQNQNQNEISRFRNSVFGGESSSSSRVRSSRSIRTPSRRTMLTTISEKQVQWADADDDDNDDGDDDTSIDDDHSSHDETDKKVDFIANANTMMSANGKKKHGIFVGGQDEDAVDDDGSSISSTTTSTTASTTNTATSKAGAEDNNAYRTTSVRGLVTRVHTAPHYDNMTDDEWSQTWYSPSEIQAIYREATNLIRDYQLRQHARRWHQSSSSSSSLKSTSRGALRDDVRLSLRRSNGSPMSPSRRTDMNDYEHNGFLRGLESYTAEGYQRIYNHRKIAQDVVLNEQYQHKKARHQQLQQQHRQDQRKGQTMVSFGVSSNNDDSDFTDHLAYMYHHNTVHCQDDAIARARYDAMEATENVEHAVDVMSGCSSSSHDCSRGLINQVNHDDVDASCETFSGNENIRTKNKNLVAFGCWPVVLNAVVSRWFPVFKHKPDAFVAM